MISSKELVKKAIEFNKPERVPYNFDSNRTPVPLVNEYGDDFKWVFVDTDPDFVPSINTDKMIQDEWGIVRYKIDKTIGEPKVHPLADISLVDSFEVPDFSDARRYIMLDTAVKENSDKYILGMFPGFLFLHMLALFGFENLMIELMMNRDKVERVADLLTEKNITVVKEMAKRNVDGIIAIEDLGVQDRLIISPQMWREIFKPRYKKIIDELHKNGMHFFIHSCGYIIELIEDMIEIGVDVIQIDQQLNMGIDKLTEKYAGRVCFFCPVDIQTVLINGTKEEIEQETKKLIRAFGAANGGFIAKTYPQPEDIDIPEENMTYMCEAFKKYGKYPLKF